MVRVAWIALGAVLLGAVALVALPLPSTDHGDPAWESPLAAALAAEFQPSGNGGFQCATCHYGFLTPFDLAAMREPSARDPASYSLTLAPVSGYELAVVWAAPRSAGDGLPDPLAEEVELQVPADGGAVRVPFTLPWPASALVAEVRAPRAEAPDATGPVEDLLPVSRPHPRPPLNLTLVGEGDVTGDLGSVPNRHAVALAGPDAPLEGAWAALVTARDPADVGQRLVVAFRAVPWGYDVRLDDGRATGSRGAAHRFQWTLPPSAAPGAPERFHVGVVVFNDHPTTTWSLPALGDRAYYEGNVSATRAASLPPAPFTDGDVAAAWEGQETLVLHEHDFDGVRARVRNDRGERFAGSARLDGQQDVDVPVFPAMPPGTTHVRATLRWELRSPASPSPAWVVGVTQRPEPDFRYPEPVGAAPGELVVEVPVAASEWERGAEGWLQAWPLLRLDPDDRAVFDGRYEFRVEALRSPAPGASLPKP